MTKLVIWLVLAGFLAIAIYAMLSARAAPAHSDIA